MLAVDWLLPSSVAMAATSLVGILVRTCCYSKILSYRSGPFSDPQWMRWMLKMWLLSSSKLWLLGCVGCFSLQADVGKDCPLLICSAPLKAQNELIGGRLPLNCRGSLSFISRTKTPAVILKENNCYKNIRMMEACCFGGHRLLFFLAA